MGNLDKPKQGVLTQKEKKTRPGQPRREFKRNDVKYQIYEHTTNTLPLN